MQQTATYASMLVTTATGQVALNTAARAWQLCHQQNYTMHVLYLSIHGAVLFADHAPGTAQARPKYESPAHLHSTTRSACSSSASIWRRYWGSHSHKPSTNAPGYAEKGTPTDRDCCQHACSWAQIS